MAPVIDAAKGREDTASQCSNKKFPLADLLRQSVYSRLAGYEDLNDAVRVSADPTFRLLGSKKNCSACSPTTWATCGGDWDCRGGSRAGR